MLHYVAFQIIAMTVQAFMTVQDSSPLRLRFGVDAVPGGPRRRLRENAERGKHKDRASSGVNLHRNQAKPNTKFNPSRN
jgi:hypothetical protein